MNLGKFVKLNEVQISANFVKKLLEKNESIERPKKI